MTGMCQLSALSANVHSDFGTGVNGQAICFLSISSLSDRP